MSVFRSWPALRWLVPSAAAVLVVGGGAAAGTIVANADPALPARSAAQLLADLGNADVDGLSGTVVQSVDLGLPPIPGLTRSTGGAADLAGLLTRSNTARVWHSGNDRERLALLTAQGETDLIRIGRDVWLWNSTDKMASHLRLPPEQKAEVPQTPQQAADVALTLIGPSTTVSTNGVVKVAGRDAYELVLSPKDKVSLVGQVRLAIDATTHIPLRVDVFARDARTPSARVAFERVSFAVPDPEQFVFNPPAGTVVREGNATEVSRQTSIIGGGWTPVIRSQLPKTARIGGLPKVSGPWGSGHLFAGSLLSVLIIEDGTVFAGPVTPARLYQAAAAR